MKLFAGRLFAGRQFVGRLFGREQVRNETGIRGGFDVDQEPALWWKRKPKALSQEEAKQRLKRAAEVIVSKAKQHADDMEPVAQRRAEVKQAIAPMLAQMPGFDWRPMYDAAYSWAVSMLIAQALDAQDKAKAMAQAAIAKARLRDEEEVALLMVLI